MGQFDGSMQHHIFTEDGRGHYTFARCESCMWGSHFEDVTWHSWAGDEDMRADDSEYNALVLTQKCACDCAGPREVT